MGGIIKGNTKKIKSTEKAYIRSQMGPHTTEGGGTANSMERVFSRTVLGKSEKVNGKTGIGSRGPIKILTVNQTPILIRKTLCFKTRAGIIHFQSQTRNESDCKIDCQFEIYNL